ncbi:MAG: hypothetical protein AVDCRST_MAG19-766 [uncultured Thermomicrobiales bacterium]|uniref:Uncharacterized protein n=1 Tax=uncultured Thermomicrobiales bacterium TaxID=1645740 RepID=A0A6J4UM34_9BACT|nr:MAG: hypothetical protein AVDCRST_MAG19-766 [uncultured Thermomicrobiales bacterium]
MPPCSSGGRRLEEADADQRTGQVQQPLEQVGTPLVADARRRQPSSQESVRSTTQRCRPNRSLDSTPRRAILGVMPRARRARRRGEES